MPFPISRETLAPLDIGLDGELGERLSRFAELLLDWNRRIKLIGRGTAPELWERHIVDSLQLVRLIPSGTTRAVDMGSGGGFPGLVLAIATGIEFDLVECDRRKAAFLVEAARITRAPARVWTARLEALQLPTARVVTARALAPLSRLIRLAAPFLADDGVCLFPKGASADSELTDAAAEWQMNVERFPSRTGEGGSILRLSEIQRVGGRSSIQG